MRKTLAVVGVLALFLSACPSKKVSSEKVVDEIVIAMCKKMATCQPNAMPSEDFCKTTMKTALSGNKDLPKLEASQQQLDQCVKAINDADCQKLLGDKPPEGCEFLK